jgi:hypothetical protein
MKVMRGSEVLVVNPSATQELQDGDSIEIIGGLLVSCAQTIFPNGLAVYFMQSAMAATVLLHWSKREVQHLP